MKKSATQETIDKATPPETVSAPPITETTLPANPAREGEQPPAETISAPPITETTAAAEKPVIDIASETVSAPPISGEEGKPVDAQPISANGNTLPPKGKGSRSFQDYLKLDWTKTNADLATECDVSRQAIAQMRRKVETHKANGGAPDFSDVVRQPAAAVQQMVDYDAMAAMVFDMSTGVLTNALGPEWQPRPSEKPGMPSEREVMCGALKAYFQSKNTPDIPPGLMLTALIISYGAPRLRAPSTASKLSMAWTWMKLKLSKFKKVKKP